MNLKYAKRSEDTEQINVIMWANRNANRHPELLDLYHVANGGSRNKAEAVKLKQMGVRAGVSDLHLPYPKGTYHSLFIEMKYENNKATKEQLDFLKRMNEAGNLAVICYGAYAAIELLEKYITLEENKEIDISNITFSVTKDKEGILVFGREK